MGNVNKKIMRKFRKQYKNRRICFWVVMMCFVLSACKKSDQGIIVSENKKQTKSSTSSNKLTIDNKSSEVTGGVTFRITLEDFCLGFNNTLLDNDLMIYSTDFSKIDAGYDGVICYKYIYPGIDAFFEIYVDEKSEKIIEVDYYVDSELYSEDYELIDADGEPLPVLYDNPVIWNTVVPSHAFNCGGAIFGYADEANWYDAIFPVDPDGYNPIAYNKEHEILYISSGIILEENVYIRMGIIACKEDSIFYELEVGD